LPVVSGQPAPRAPPAPAPAAEIVNKAIPSFSVSLPLGQESPTFIQNATQLAARECQTVSSA
ncbi:MAG TPA: hypothetical protein VN922_19105, partial [Bacteroidia bacterium]|nr:hypothetical protein [Bacteroidia bacterium]